MAQQVIISRKNLTFLGFDFWGRAVYKHINGRIFKDISLKSNNKYIPDKLYDSADNTFEGEPNNPYNIIN